MDVQETLDASIQALQDEQAEQNPAEAQAVLRPPFGHDLWSNQVSWMERCTQCQREQPSACRQWINYLPVEVNEGTGDLHHRLYHPKVDTLMCNFNVTSMVVTARPRERGHQLWTARAEW
jgi:hypothetical protein